MPKLLEVADLRTWFHTTEGTVKAVGGITNEAQRNRTQPMRRNE